MLEEKCPYCGEEIEINHDDGYGLEEGKNYEQECYHCEKTFVYTTTICILHELRKADCLNGGQHKWHKTHTFPKFLSRIKCEICGKVKDDEE